MINFTSTVAALLFFAAIGIMAFVDRPVYSLVLAAMSAAVTLYSIILREEETSIYRR